MGKTPLMSNFTKSIIAAMFILVAYLFFALTKNFYNNYKIDKYISDFKRENESIELENRLKTDDYLYFTSEEYIDKIAKQNLGLVNYGEEVIILAADVFNDEYGGDYDRDGDFAKYNVSVAGEWWDLFFGG